MTQDQVQHVDAIVFAEIRRGVCRVEPIMEATQGKLLAGTDAWARVLARSARLKQAVRASLARLRDGGKIRCSGKGTAAEWHMTLDAALDRSAS